MPVLKEAELILRSELAARACLCAVTELPWFGGRLPDLLEEAYKPVPIDRGWIDRVSFDAGVDAEWGVPKDGFIYCGRNRDLQIRKYNTEFTAAIALDLLRTVPFETAVAPSPHKYTWTDDPARQSDPLYIPRSGWGFGHGPHGWACFLRGRGHEQVVSRRYLHHGPWRTVHLPQEDLTLVQFHDLDADVHTAIEQASIGHLLMGYSPVGGIFFHRGDAHPLPELTGNYSRRTKTFFYMMLDKRISPKLASDLGWLRLHNRDGRGEIGKPVENIRLVYWDEEKALEDLEIAWRCEFEVACMIEGKEVRLDEGYESTWEAPDWVKRLQDEEGF